MPLSQDTGSFQTLACRAEPDALSLSIALRWSWRRSRWASSNRCARARAASATRARKVELKPAAGMQKTSAELATYLTPTDLMATDRIVRDTAIEITRRYALMSTKPAPSSGWWRIPSETRRRGFGSRDIRVMLEAKALNGKCADLNALFVGLLRAAGVPARDVYGIRVAESPRGYRSLKEGR